MKTILSFFCLFLFSGCIACPPRYDYHKADVPQWIYKLPEEKGRLYAWGSCGQSMGIESVKRFALENARKTLALAKGAKIVHKTRKLDLYAQDVYTKIQPIENWEKMEYEVVEEWMDAEGKAGLGYQYFILVRTK